MKILNHAQFNHHMDPKNNYLAGNGLENTKPPEIVSIPDSVLESESESEVNHEAQVLTGPILLENRGKLRVGERSKNIPDFLRQTVAIVANEPGVKQKDVAEAFGLKGPMVSKAANGIISYPNGKDETLTKVVNDRKTEIKDLALNKTLAALNLLTADDIELLGAKDKADVAAKLAKVADSMTEKNIAAVGNVQFVIMTPQVRETVHYDTIEV